MNRVFFQFFFLTDLSFYNIGILYTHFEKEVSISHHILCTIIFVSLIRGKDVKMGYKQCVSFL